MRLLLADDHALVRGGLRALIADLPEIDEVVEAADGDEALAAVAMHRPDIVLMDIGMPRLNGIQATSLILAIAPKTRVMVISMHHDEETIWNALRAGPAPSLAKPAGLGELREALQSGRRGEVSASRKLRRAVQRE